jgi:hypothetical protein
MTTAAVPASTTPIEIKIPNLLNDPLLVSPSSPRAVI